MAEQCPGKVKNTDCTCPHTDCARHGACCACVKYHRADGSLPCCFREKR